MDIKEVADKAKTLFSDEGRAFGFQKPDSHLALRGYFKGVANGTVNVGQQWVADLLLSKNVAMRPEDAELFEEIFASGMCCHGQSLEAGRGKGLLKR